MPVLATVLIGVALVLLALHLVTRVLAARAARAVPQRGKVVPVEGGSVHYIEAGDRAAVPVVLIHGLTGQLQNFDFGMIEDLARDFRVIVLDRPGCGYSERESDAWSPLDKQAQMIWAALDALGVERPVLVGHSLGGAVVLTMALQRPEGTGALALLSPATHVVGDVPDIFKPLTVRPDALRWAMAQTITAPMGRLTVKQTLAAAFAPEPAHPEFELRGGAVLMYRPWAFVNASRDAGMLEAALGAQQGRYDRLGVAGGVLFGSGDALLPPEAQGAVMARYGLSYEVLAGRGHMLPVTAPEECAGFVRRMAALRAA